MEPKNEQIRQTLICQYSRFANLSTANLSQRLQQTDWWVKEQYRLNVQQKVALVAITIVMMLFLSVILFSFSRGSVPLFSFITYSFSFFLVQRVYSRIEERSRIYKVMRLAFDRN